MLVTFNLIPIKLKAIIMRKVSNIPLQRKRKSFPGLGRASKTKRLDK
jgi:hypothetical protein